jgi:hypothetical protein
MEKLEDTCQQMEDNLKVWCAGLVEVKVSWKRLDSIDIQAKVQYLHRAAKDILKGENVRKYLLLRTSGTPFNPDVSLLKGSIFQVKIHDVIQKAQRCYYLATVAMACTLQADKAQVSQTAMLDDLDTTINNSSSQSVSWGHLGQVPQLKEWQESFLSMSIGWGSAR